jgi:hypothetical protein
MLLRPEKKQQEKKRNYGKKPCKNFGRLFKIQIHIPKKQTGTAFAVPVA